MTPLFDVIGFCIDEALFFPAASEPTLGRMI
jgi:hypothetical protein